MKTHELSGDPGAGLLWDGCRLIAEGENWKSLGNALTSNS